MDRRSFIVGSCACSAAVLSGVPGLALAAASPGDTQAQPINPEQVMAVLGDIDRSGDPSLIDSVFSRWGYQCFHTRAGLKAFAERQRADFQSYVDYVNAGRAKYWERMEYDRRAGTLRIIGRKTGQCACAYAQTARPARALCTHCCRSFQEALFGHITGRPVHVRIDEAILLGAERCSTTIQIEPAPS